MIGDGITWVDSESKDRAYTEMEVKINLKVIREVKIKIMN